MRKALFALILFGGIWPVVGALRPSQEFPTRRAQTLEMRGELQCFASRLLQYTSPGDTIRYLVPPDLADSGLINHWLRYILPDRYVEPAAVATPTGRKGSVYLATWHERPPPGRVIWSGCGGVLTLR